MHDSLGLSPYTVPMRKRWRVVWYNVFGDVIREDTYLTHRAAERARRTSAPPVWLPNLYSSIAEKV
jgi:hypothetical protein